MGVEILPGDGRVEVGGAVLHRQAVVVVAGPVQELHYIEYRIDNAVDRWLARAPQAEVRIYC